MTWAEYADKVRRVAAGLAGLGLERGGSMGIMLTNRPEFHWFDAAALHLGATPFSVYNTYAPEQIQYQVKDAEARIVVTEKAFEDRIRGARGRGARHRRRRRGTTWSSTRPTASTSRRPGGRCEPEDILTLIYTSGTTGPPKGVQLTHSNLISAVQGFDDVIAFPGDGRVVSWLPMAHIAERACSHYLPMLLGFTTTDCPDPRQVVVYLPEVRPTWFFAVPRIFEKLKAAIEAGIEAEQDAARKQATQWALDVGLRKVRLEQAGEPVPEELRAEHAKADELVLSKIRAKLGLDSIESINVGAAPTPREVIEFFHAIGMPLAELWGMSETTGYGTCNPPDRIKIGTVGPVSPGVEIKLADDGEVLIRGPVITPGYRNQPDKTARRDRRRGLAVHGRRGRVRRRRLPEDRRPQEGADHQRGRQEHVAGQHRGEGEGRQPRDRPGGRDRRHEALQRRADHARPRRGARVPGSTGGASPAEVERGVAAANEQMARVEQIKRYKVLDDEWEPGGDELTPTMKLKRKPIHEKYAKEIEALYA